MLFTPRIEQKLELDKFEYYKLLIWLKDNNAKTLYPTRIICSKYFDTIDFKIYNNTLEGIVPRKKIRIRKYNSRDFISPDSLYNLEIKITGTHQRYKSVTKNIKIHDLINYGYYDNLYGTCYQQVEISYLREYYSFEDLRITIDRDIIYQFTGLGKALIYKQNIDPKFVIEVKTSMKKSLDNILTRLAFPRTRFSKYERAMNYLLKDY